MILNDIKKGITEAFYKADKDITVYFEDVSNVAFPFCRVLLTDFYSNSTSTKLKIRYDFSFRIIAMKSRNNKLFELLDMYEVIKNALIPCIKIKDKKITLEDAIFSVSDDKLFFDFKIGFYEVEDDETELMQTLDITVKEN